MELQKIIDECMRRINECMRRINEWVYDFESKTELSD